MTGYPFRSWSRRMAGVAVGALVATVVLSLACALLRPLLPVFLAVSALTVVLALVFRWQLFRFRGW